MKRNDTHIFKYHGVQRTLRRRGRAPGTWTMRVVHAGKQRWISLKTNIPSEAEAAAKEWLGRPAGMPITSPAAPTTSTTPTTFVTYFKVSDVIEALWDWPGSLSQRSRKNYVWCLGRMFETVYPKETNWKELNLEVLNKQFVSDYKQAIEHEAKAARTSPGKMQTAYRTANSILRQARAMFGPHLVDYYTERKKIVLPDLTPFRSVLSFRNTRKSEYNRPSDELIARTFADLEVEKEKCVSRYLAIWIAYGFGLRRSEIAPLKRSNFITINGRPYVEIRCVAEPIQERDITKNGEVAPKVKCTNDAWTRIEPLIRAIKPEEYIFGGTPTSRAEDLFRDINAWLRAKGWQTQKGIHEIRAFAGCKVAERDGLMKASFWLRHGSINTTQQYYGRYINAQVSDSEESGPQEFPVIEGFKPHVHGGLSAPGASLALRNAL